MGNFPPEIGAQAAAGHVQGHAQGLRRPRTVPAPADYALVVISGVSAVAAIIGEATNNAAGYVFLCVAAATTYVVRYPVYLVHVFPN